MPSRRVEERSQMFFEAAQQKTPSLAAIFGESILIQKQRRAIIVKALNNGLNPPLLSIIRYIEDNHAVGGADTAILWYPKTDGTKISFEVQLNELYRIQERRIAASKGHGGRQRRLRGF